MELSPEERKAMEAEWAKGNKWGAALARKRAIATIVSSAVLGVFMLPAIVLLSPRLMILSMVVGVPLGMLVRKKLMPKGQFGGG
jgi:hypothetical protein